MSAIVHTLFAENEEPRCFEVLLANETPIEDHAACEEYWTRINRPRAIETTASKPK